MARILVTDRDGGRHKVTAAEGVLMEALRDADLGVAAICGGQCACATCHCFIEPDWAPRLPPADEDEVALISCLDHYDPERSRLTCQIRVTDALDGLPLTVAPEE